MEKVSQPVKTMSAGLRTHRTSSPCRPCAKRRRPEVGARPRLARQARQTREEGRAPSTGRKKNELFCTVVLHGPDRQDSALRAAWARWTPACPTENAMLIAASQCDGGPSRDLRDHTHTHTHTMFLCGGRAGEGEWEGWGRSGTLVEARFHSTSRGVTNIEM